MNWTLDKLIRVKKETDCTWYLMGNILNYSGILTRINTIKTMNLSFPSDNGKLTNDNLTDTLIPFIQSLSEYARDNGNKKFYGKLQNLIKELGD